MSRAPPSRVLGGTRRARQTNSPVSLLTRSRPPPAANRARTAASTRAACCRRRVLDRRRRRQVLDDVVGVAAVERSRYGRHSTGRTGTAAAGPRAWRRTRRERVGPLLAEHLAADLVELGQVPVADAGHDGHAARPQHPGHLAHGPTGVGHVVEHVVGHHDVECRRPERQLLDVGHPPGGAPVAAERADPFDRLGDHARRQVGEGQVEVRGQAGGGLGPHPAGPAPHLEHPGGPGQSTWVASHGNHATGRGAVLDVQAGPRRQP